jgi:hypothetical protein
MASKNLTLVFQCTLTQLTTAAQRTLGLRNLLEADSIIGNLLHAIPNSGAIQSVWCSGEKEDGCTVTLKNYTTDERGEPTSEPPSDPTEFHKAAKGLQDLIFPEPHEISDRV